jgi:nucleotide-binding universal stress UspA family protein
MRCSQVLAPVDLSDESKAAARLAASLARRDHGTVTLLLVDLLPEVGERLASHAPADVFGSYLDDRVETLKQELGELAGTLGDVDVKTAVARDDVATAILERAASDGSDLVVLGAHRPGSPLDLVVGNVVAAVAARASCPLLVARASPSRPLGDQPFSRPLVVALLPRRPDRGGGSLALAKALAAPGARVEVVFTDAPRGPDAPLDADALREEFELAAAQLRAEGASAAMLWSDGSDVLTLLLEHRERRGHDVMIVEKRTPGVLGAMVRRLLDHAPVPIALVTTA